jgi:pheromone shutdown-related protein TraB
MMEYRNLTIIGTSHIAKESIEEIKRHIEANRPDVVALELDRQRFLALTSGKKSKPNLWAITKIGLNGMIFLLLGQFAQNALGKLVGTKPGSEMLTAIHEARKHNLAIALIDQDIEITLRRFSTQIPLKEKLRIFLDIITGFFPRDDEVKSWGIRRLDLSKVPDEVLIQKLMGVLAARYPSVYRVLVAERNEVMANNLVGLIAANPDKKILAVVGAGHEADLLQMVSQRYEQLNEGLQ